MVRSSSCNSLRTLIHAEAVQNLYVGEITNWVDEHNC
jgi:hypothetical protein